jgi:ligand-binding sensor domain-containing protein
MAFDSKNNLWTYGSGGLESWNLKDRTYTKHRIDDRILDTGGINEFIEGADGAMWFATSAGVAGLEGERWIFLGDDNNLAKTPVTSVAKGPDGALWFGWKGGLIKFNGDTWNSYTEADGLLDNAIMDIAINNKGTVWISSSKGMSQYDGQKWKTYREEDYGMVFGNGGPISLAIAPDGSVWGGLWGFAVVHIKDDKLSVYWIGQSYTRFGPFVDSIGVGPDGKLWVSTQDSGIFWFDGNQWSNFTRALGISDPYDGSFCGGGPILSGPDGAVWFGNFCNGVIRYDGQWWQMNYNDGLRGNKINTVAVAEDGAMWFATDYGSVSRFDGTHWKTYILSLGQGLTKISAMAACADGDIWVGGYSDIGSYVYGLFRFHDQQWSNFASKLRLGSENVVAIAEAPDGAMWFGSAGIGISRYDGKEWKNFTIDDGLSNNYINGMVFDHENNLWVATYNGVSRYDGTVWTKMPDIPGSDKNFVRSIGMDSLGRIWVGSSTFAAYFDITGWVTSFEVPDTYIGPITLGPDGSMWFGTGNGVVRLKDGKIYKYHSWDGLANNTVRSIAAGRDGAMWFGTGAGVSRFDWINSP